MNGFSPSPIFSEFSLGFRHEPRRPRIAQRFGRIADELSKCGAVGLKLGAGLADGGLRPACASASLRDVGLRDLADLEPILSGFQLLGQDPLIVYLQIEHGLIAHDVHIGGHRIQQHVLLGVAKILPSGLDPCLRSLHRIDGAEAAENGLNERHGVVVGGEIPFLPGKVRTGIDVLELSRDLPLMVGRKPDFARATFSSVARSWARAALSVGLNR